MSSPPSVEAGAIFPIFDACSVAWRTTRLLITTHLNTRHRTARRRKSRKTKSRWESTSVRTGSFNPVRQLEQDGSRAR